MDEATLNRVHITHPSFDFYKGNDQKYYVAKSSQYKNPGQMQAFRHAQKGTILKSEMMSKL